MKNKIWIFLLIVLFSIVIRVYYLGRDSVNPDAVNWHYRCQQFANGLKYLQFEKTYPHYHPGVTLCWAMVFPTELYKKATGDKEYNISNFYNFNFINSLSVVILVSILIGLCFWQLDLRNGLIFVLLLNLEPFYFGNSKFIHLDIIHSLLTLLTLLYLKRFLMDSKSYSYIYYSAISLGFAFLTKSISIIFLLPILMILFFYFRAEFLKNILRFFLTFLVTVFLFFPALWISPINTIYTIFSEASRVGVNRGHNQFFLGNYFDDDSNPGFLFYPIAALIKFSPLIIFTLILILKDSLKFIGDLKVKNLKNFNFWIVFFYLFYFIVISYSEKKVDRYLLLLIPGIVYYLSITYSRYFKSLLFLSLINIYSIFVFWPNQFLYYSPIFLNYSNVNNLLGQKSFGIAVFDFKDYLIKNYGEKSLGFYDVKPFETIYPNSKVFDIREVGPSKIDIVILSLNESLPEEYLGLFSKKETYFVKDIPLYEIYTKN